MASPERGIGYNRLPAWSGSNLRAYRVEEYKNIYNFVTREIIPRQS